MSSFNTNPEKRFPESYTLSDAFELIGRRLFSHTWTGQEYNQQDTKSPEELAHRRRPLEAELAGVSTELEEIELTIGKTLDCAQIKQLTQRRNELESRRHGLNVELNLNMPALNDVTRATFEAGERRNKSEDLLLCAIRENKIKVHDGHGRELNQLVWTDPRFRFYIDLSIVVNGKMSGEPRRQAARIDRTKFLQWLATVKPLVVALHVPSLEDRLRDFLRRAIATAADASRKTKPQYFEDAKRELGHISKQTFEQIWKEIVPAEWHSPGPLKGRKPSHSK